MEVFIEIMKYDSSVESIAPVDIVSSVVRFCNLNKVDKVLIDESLAVRSPHTAVNIEAFVKMLKVRGVTAVVYTTPLEYPLKSLDILYKDCIQQITKVIKQSTYTNGNKLLLTFYSHIPKNKLSDALTQIAPDIHASYIEEGIDSW